MSGKRIYSVDCSGVDPAGISAIVTDEGKIIIDGILTAEHVKEMLASIAANKRIAELEAANVEWQHCPHCGATILAADIENE